MTLEQLIARAREQINARITMRNQYATELSELRGADTVDEARVEDLRARQAGIDAELAELQRSYEALQAEQAADAATARLQASVTPTDTRAPSYDGVARVGAEARTYTPESDRRGAAFFGDVVASFVGDQRASERLRRHMDEEQVERAGIYQRAVSTSTGPGLVVPQYLVDMYAPKGRPGRKFADQCRHHELPETGMSVEIPRQKAKTSTGEQTTENTTVTEVDYEDEMISVKVRTAAGSQTISRQSAERSAGTEQIIVADLFKAYDSDLDSLLINAPTWGLLAVANAVTYTDADPTALELYAKILGAAANVEDVLLDLDEDDLVTLMRGRRWAWLQNQTTDKWPFISAAGFPVQAGGISDNAPYSAGVRGRLPNGGSVVTDNNLPANLGTGTNEDVAVVVARQEAHLWEDPAAPVFIRAEQSQVKKLSVDLVLYGYFAACFNRVVDAQGTPKAVHQKITGTGLVPPTF